MDCAAGPRKKGTGRPFPDWRGDIVVVCASGPSQRQDDIEAARGQARLIVINETWRLAPWADALYACDGRWWRHRGPKMGEFPGLRIQGHVRKGEVLHEGAVHGGVVAGLNSMSWDGVRLGSGGNSGFQAVNLAVMTGARRVVLLGFDMGFDGAKHWHSDHEGAGLSNPDQRFLAQSARILDRAAADIAARGIEVVNASRQTALRAFRRAPLKEALA